MTPTAVDPLFALLRQLADLVESLTDDEYTRKPVGVVPSSVGCHVRHNLDHVESLLRGLRTGDLDYDRRDRGTDIERDRAAAVAAIDRLEEAIHSVDWNTVPRTLILTALVAPDRSPVVLPTTADRELAFVVSHTIHHNALIGVMVKLIGADPPADFGYAPATVVHQRSRACVR